MLGQSKVYGITPIHIARRNHIHHCLGVTISINTMVFMSLSYAGRDRQRWTRWSHWSSWTTRAVGRDRTTRERQRRTEGKALTAMHQLLCSLSSD